MEITYPPNFAPFDLLLLNTIRYKDRQVLITSLTSAPGLVYVGTNDGFLIIYEYQMVDELFQCKRKATLQLGSTGNSIEKIVVIQEFASVLVLSSEGQLSILNMFSLDISARIPKELNTIGQLMRGNNRVISFCIQYPAELFRVCCQVKGALMFYEILGSKNEQPQPFLTIPLLEYQQGTHMLWTGRRCFIGTPREYVTCELPLSAQQTPLYPQPLFQLPEATRPYMIIASNDILLASGRVGVFVDFNGTITRGSITWSAEPISVCYSAPYIIAMLSKSFEIHNIFDQKPVQSLPYTQLLKSLHHGYLPLSHSGDQIYTVLQKPFENQLEDLIRLGQINSAIGFAKSMWASEPRKLVSFFGKVGIMWFVQGKWDQAVLMLLGSSIDIRELISLFKELPPSAEAYTCQYNLQFDPSVNIDEGKAHLLKILESKRSRTMIPPVLLWTDTAMIKLYLETKSEKLDSFYEISTIQFEDAEKIFTQYSSLKQLAKLYKKYNKLEKAISIIQSIGLEEIIKTGYDPLDDAIELLNQCDNAQFVFDNSRWIMDRDANRGIQLFISPNKKAKFDCNEILEYLKPFGKFTQIEYLEYVIFQEGNIDEYLHTQLGIMCIDLIQNAVQSSATASRDRRRARVRATNIVEGVPDSVILQRLQQKLIRLLKYSNYYNISTLLGRINAESLLYDESVILYSKLGKHSEALDILVHKKQDFEGADAYCAQQKDKNLFSDLLKLYLTPTDLSSCNSIPENAFRLLNSRATALNAIEVLSMLPNDTPIHIVEEFITRAYQHSISEKRMKLVENGLCHMERIQTKTQLQKAFSHSIVIDRSVLCVVCKNPIGESVFATYPNGKIVHFKCMEDKHICPVTKRNFQKFPISL